MYIFIQTVSPKIRIIFESMEIRSLRIVLWTYGCVTPDGFQASRNLWQTGHTPGKLCQNDWLFELHTIPIVEIKIFLPKLCRLCVTVLVTDALSPDLVFPPSLDARLIDFVPISGSKKFRNNRRRAVLTCN